jgi:hypothetical protein
MIKPILVSIVLILTINCLVSVEFVSLRSIPLSEGFEALSFPPNEWQTTTWIRNISFTYLITGSATAMYRTTGNTNGKRLITPKLRVTSSSSLTFKAKHGLVNFGEQLKIKYSANNINWTALQTVSLTSSAIQTTIDLGAITPGDYYFCFETYSNDTSDVTKSYVIDDVCGPPLTSSIHYGTLVCHINDINSLNPIAGANILINGKAGVSDSNGIAIIDSLDCGEQTLSCLAEGYNDYMQTVTVPIDDTLELYVNLIPVATEQIRPRIVSFERVGFGSVIEWDLISGAVCYHVYCSSYPDTMYALVTNVTGTEISIADSVLVVLGINPKRAFFRVTAEIDDRR